MLFGASGIHPLSEIQLMNSNSKPASTETPKLAPPGAGIPWPTRMAMKYLFKPWVMRRAAWDDSLARFEKMHAKIKRELTDIPKDRLLDRILVPQQTGLEDSSRYWSAAMVARHLTIVGTQMEAVVITLSQGNTVDRVADTARVKPEDSKNDLASIEEYLAWGDSVMERVQKAVVDRRSKVKFKHPWFGMMNANEWFYLFAGHLTVHLQQLRAIKSRL